MKQSAQRDAMQEDISPWTDSQLGWVHLHHCHIFAVILVPVTNATAVKYIVFSPLLEHYRDITIVPIIVQLSNSYWCRVLNNTQKFTFFTLHLYKLQPWLSSVTELSWVITVLWTEYVILWVWWMLEFRDIIDSTRLQSPRAACGIMLDAGWPLTWKS